MENKKQKKGAISIVQPNKVTNARYEFSAVQENILTCMIGALQDHMTQKKDIREKIGISIVPMITLKASDIAQGHNKAYVLSQLNDLRKKDIDFEYTDDQGRTNEVNTGLISASVNIRETDFIQVEISTWAIPYLVYWGKGVGGTVFNKTLALTLKGIYAKRMYKLCKRWEDRGGFTIPIDEFRQMLAIENKLKKPSDIKRRLLEPAKKELQEKADIYFEYEFKKIKSRSYNSISFKIFSQKGRSMNDNTSAWYQYVYLFLCRVWPDYGSDRALETADKLDKDKTKLRAAYEKFKRLDDQVSKGTKRKEDLIRLTKHILKEDFEIKP